MVNEPMTCGCPRPRLKKDRFNCSVCNKLFCPSHVFYYVDANNGRITKNSRPHCMKCYKEKYKY